ncbi:substrate-binding domain-containing protein [Clostridium sp. KNHs216]|jgi:ABC-type sugar transport system, periplasmic component|uniref:substrate-binding domain-containing protein n=1 Tax=Clostridium sp. KNHs216 TaxID=1550235 RepID=UPI001151CB3F|nr:substrate-binding domain-containing protein [Clostridium sp. KNHs216]TQI66458.1 ribose transport system substrate-binding protein [Clostridium sp. KNHs216]
MKKKILAILLCAAMAVTAFAGCGQAANPASAENNASAGDAGSAAAPASDKKIKVILITMDSLDQHWVSVDKGAQKAVAELGNIEYKWMAPDKKDDAQQIERVNNAIADGADAIMIAANGPDAISASLEDAKAKGIKIIYVDSPAKTEGIATFATDNEAAGKTAGEEMLKALEAAGKKDGKIGIVNVNSATASTVAREKGFRAAFDGKGYTLLQTQYGEGDATKSQDIADNYITEGAVGIFGCNEGSTVGAGNAIKGSGKKDIVGVGFDKSDSIFSLIKDGSLLCAMAQNPDVMGYEGMKAAVKAVKGETIEKTSVDTGVSVLNKDTIK